MDRPAAGLGPRLAGRLTAELIARSAQYMSCCNDYEIDLRGNKIAVIENLGATKNQFDSVDLSDNAVVKLEGFPKLPRLKTLLLSNNRIARIAHGLEESIPNLEWLVLTSNKLAHFADLAPLGSLPKLTHLSLLDNPVTKQHNYRLYVISRCPRLKVLDFRKVKAAEREAAAAAYGGAEGEAAAAGGGDQFEPDEELARAEAKAREEAERAREPEMQKGPTPEQIVAIKAAIANASTLEEVQRLEAALKGGNMPSEVQVGGKGSTANGEHATAMDEG